MSGAMLVASCALVAAACVGPVARSSDEGSQGRIGSEAVDRPVDDAPGAGADGADGVAASDSGPGAELVEVEITATFEDAPCEFELPPGEPPRCGVVRVPMDWESGDGVVELAVAVFASTAADPEPEPVVYLEGGPGSHSLDTIVFSAEEFLAPLRARGDVVFFDQRGVGRSSPRLVCDETEAVSRRIEDEPSLEDDEATAAFYGALGECRERLVGAGIDLTAFNSINSAHDVEAIRLALGYERWNLLGISYGTKLGLEVLRRHPESVRAAVLDSVYPPEVDSVLENPTTFVESFERVMAGCDREPACAAGGDLEARIRAVVARYEADPVEVQVDDWVSGAVDQQWVTGETVIELVIGALYSPSQFTDIPELIDELEAGATGAVSAFLSQERTSERFFTNGMFYAVACHEEVSFADRRRVASGLPADPFGLRERFDYAWNLGELAFDTCAAFANGRAPAVSNTAVSSDVPTLLLAGAYDPVTPVSWAETAARALENATVVVAPAGSHGISGDRCGMSIVVAFLAEPGAAVDDRCLSADQLEFVAGATPAVELEPVTYEVDGFDTRISTVRPAGWLVGGLGGDQYRQRSFLDAAELYQLAGDEILAAVLADFIESDHELSLSPARQLDDGPSIGPISAADLSRSWAVRSGRSASVAVEWFETDIADRRTMVVLVSPVAELDTLLGAVVLPALSAIEVTAG